MRVAPCMLAPRGAKVHGATSVFCATYFHPGVAIENGDLVRGFTNGGSFHSCYFTRGKPPFSYGFLMVSYGFPTVLPLKHVVLFPAEVAQRTQDGI